MKVNDLALAKKEIALLTDSLYREYVNTKELREKISYLETLLSKREKDLEDMSYKLLNGHSYS
jgi:hypothetical protein|tara:strand:+ start:9215 stop:9403 length:189 start_codon:yes stop_codon:yes gene_type:complete